MYDHLFLILLKKETNLLAGVALKDIRSIADLEANASNVAPASVTREISFILDFNMRLKNELDQYNSTPECEKYQGGPCAFFKCNNTIEFFTQSGFDGV